MKQKENLTLHQVSLRALFHAPFNLSTIYIFELLYSFTPGIPPSPTLCVFVLHQFFFHLCLTSALRHVKLLCVHLNKTVCKLKNKSLAVFIQQIVQLNKTSKTGLEISAHLLTHVSVKTVGRVQIMEHLPELASTIII